MPNYNPNEDFDSLLAALTPDTSRSAPIPTSKVYGSEEEKQADLVLKDNLLKKAKQKELMDKVQFALRNSEMEKLKGINPGANPGDVEIKSSQNLQTMSDQDKLNKFYELNPSMAPKQPADLDPTMMKQFANMGQPEANKTMGMAESLPQRAMFSDPSQMIREPASAAPQMIKQKESVSMQGPAPSGLHPDDHSNLQSILFGKNDLSTLGNLKSAQADRDSVRDSARRDRLAALLGSSFSGVPNEYLTGEADRKDKLAPEKIQDFEQQVAMQKQDPNSAVSKGYREMMKRFDVNVQGDASATDIEKIAPWIEKAYEGEQNRAARKEDMKYRYDAMAESRRSKKEDKDELESNHFIERASKQLGRTADDYAKVRQAAKLAEGMDPKNPVAQVTALYNFISSLDPASTVREGEIHLATSTGGLSGRLETVMSQLSSQPQLINEQTVKGIQSEIKRIAKAQGDNYKSRSDLFRKQAKSRGVEDRFGEIDPYDGGNTKTGYSSSQEQGIKNVMDHNGVSREEAIDALKNAGKLD